MGIWASSWASLISLRLEPRRQWLVAVSDGFLSSLQTAGSVRRS